jgi:hypothetical protein
MRGHKRRWAATEGYCMNARRAVVFVVLVVAAGVGMFPRQSVAQDSADDGHSYMHITIGDHVPRNLVINEQYQKGGWLAVELVLVKNTGQTHAAAGKKAGLPKGWGLLSVEMKSGHHGPGTLSFGVGDNGGLDPLLAAQKNGTVIPSADLDLFPNYGEGRTLIGKYRIKGIRIVAVEDVPASACAMYEVTVRFQSIEPRAAQ